MDNTRARVLAAATRLFAKHGLRKTTIRDIASAARVAKGALYYYFQNKEDVFATILRQELQGIWYRTQEAIDAAKEPPRKLFAYLTTVTAEIRKSEILQAVMDDDFPGRFEVIEKILTETRDQEIRQLAEIITLGVSEGLFARVDSRKVAQTIVYAFEGLLSSPLIAEPDIIGDSGRPGVVFTLILNGLRQR